MSLIESNFHPLTFSLQEEEDPLNSDDDDSDHGSTEFEATDNVVVCLFDKVGSSTVTCPINA